jgi:GR25 family glycosyltransferase involved in LPS biosynthesis/glycosyltransferase involved in cell wall biosynthesis
MIVKNESHVIKETLVNLCSYFDFSYWVICDTGSTDGTQQIIRDFFGEKGISGELLEHEWKDFGHNRSLALAAAYDKTDYLLVFDADDRIVGDFKLPREMTADSYYLKIGKEFSYKRTLIVNNRKKWCFKGVLHEFITCLEDASQSVDITGNYYMESSRSGSRNADPLKYSNDAAILEKAYVEERDDGLRNRYVFYCAQSYKDAGNIPKAIEWYKKVLDLKTWDQEKYISYLRLGECFKHIGDEINMMYYWTKGYSFMPSRAETLYQLINYYRHKGEHRLCEMYYNVAKKICNPDTSALFNSNDVYEYKLDEEYTIFSYYVGNRNIDEQMRKLVSDGRASFGLLMSNSQFYTENKLKLIKDANGAFKLVDNVFTFPSKEERTELYKTSKNILFFTGWCDRRWNYSYTKTNSLGGSEKAVAYLTQYFPKDYTVYVAGGVEPEVVDNVIYVNNDSLKELLKITTFHTVICSRFVGFLEIYADVLKFYQFYLWAHDTSLLRSYTELTVSQILDKWDNHIDGCVCLTQWHSNHFNNLYPTLKNKISVINNGIVPEFFKPHEKLSKIKNRYIYTSCTERGLDIIINMWSAILSRTPDATLVIFGYNKFPTSELDFRLEKEMSKYKNSIFHLGQLYTSQIYEQMRLAEFWLYPNNWAETSCITALEMLASEVICVYYPLAGLANTLGSYGIQVTFGNELSTILGLSEEQKNEIRIKGKEYALSCSWENRANKWFNLIENISFNEIKIINLERRIDRKEKMINELNKQNIWLKESNFYKAVDGRKTKLDSSQYNLFKNNDFNYRRGVVGAALSHLGLWRELINDDVCDFYIIMEDDISLSPIFLSRINEWILNYKNCSMEFTFFGYSMFSKNRNKLVDDCNSNSIIKMRRNLYIGGFFCYAITKSAAKKLVNYVNDNGITEAIDSLVKCPSIEFYESIPHIAHTEWNENGKKIDTDIQTDFESVEIENDSIITENFIFLNNKDQIGYDIKEEKSLSLNEIAALVLEDDSAIAFNTYKCIKHSLIEITDPHWFTGNHGIYIKKQAYLDYCERMNIKKNETVIELVASQCNVSREKAQETLLKNNGDIIQSIIELLNAV